MGTGAKVHVEWTPERILDDLVDAQIEFLSSRTAEEQIDDVLLEGCDHFNVVTGPSS